MSDLNRAPGLKWATSSYSGNGSQCIEVAALSGAVAMRDTKNQSRGPVLTVPGAAWRAFVGAAVNDRLRA
ncbi:DUF397 domain-containing protein [Streptomyces hoynatensis]|uniref:DUF397 domain-containing protein n=1 Tax=Streptomyces hoynatensis TaxID=1141874 RepID=A0A3A9ZHN6_9ACTN|nr:DUF397 domain-containing protein [Streptomyces hoynatensis]RKN46867.1 DUF397 domain-containing protein [Streptomyces hoynatensis]